jgi:hypothetical protein
MFWRFFPTLDPQVWYIVVELWNFIEVWKSLLSETVPNFWQFSTKPSYKISKIIWVRTLQMFQ